MLYLNQYIGRAMLCLNPERHCKGKAKSHEDCMSVVIFGNSAVCIPRELQWEERVLYLRLLYLSAALSLAQLPKPDRHQFYIPIE